MTDVFMLSGLVRTLVSWSCLLAGCAAPPDAEMLERVPWTAAQQASEPGARPVAKVRSVSASGSLCNVRDAVRFKHPEAWKGDVAALVVDAKIDSFGAPNRAITKECAIDITWDVPEGFQFQGTTAYLQEYFTEVGGTKSESTITYTFEGSRPETFTWRVTSGRLMVTTHTLKEWSPSCGAAAKPVRLRVTLRTTVSGGKQGIYSLDGLDVQLASQARWRRCESP
jgi:hypothetical protein